MRTNSFLRAIAPLMLVGLLAGCSRSADDPYSAIEDAPLVRARLHTVTLASADAGVVDRIRQDGYSPVPPHPNYPGAVRVEAALWKVPEEVAAKPVVLMAPGGQGPNVRVLAIEPPAAAVSAERAVLESFYRQVLGSQVPDWRGSANLPANARVQAWTFLVDDVVVARRRLREAGIPVTFDAVAITTAYFGDHKVLGVTAPDGVVVELVETAAH
jgi:hypothetical protein